MKNKIIDLTLTILSVCLLIASTPDFLSPYLVFIAFIPFLFAIRRNNISPIILGTIFGFILWLVTLSWLLITVTTFGHAPMAFAVVLLIIIALGCGFITIVPFAYIARRYNNALLLAMVYIGMEAVKSTLFVGGTPWINLAQTQYENITILQSVSVFGEYGLSFLIIMINVTLYNIIVKSSVKFNSILLTISLVAMLAPGIFAKDTAYDSFKKIKIVQTGYNQSIKWDPNMQMSIINGILLKLYNIDYTQYDLVVLPESTFPATTMEVPFLLNRLNEISKITPIIIGSERRENGNYYNSMVLFDNGTTQIYDKIKLAPFGEFFPFMPLLKPLKEYFYGKGKLFTAGTKPMTLDSNGFKIAPLICYEGAFSQLLKDHISLGANIVVLISNDSWFGESLGRYQHLAIDVIRAVEYKKTILRATQDGISAVILPDGKIIAKITEPIAADIDLEVGLRTERTFYEKFGYLWIAIIIPLIYYMIKRKKVS